MYLLKLFHQSDPATPIAARMISDGLTRVGRDPASDWVIPDEDCEISRQHLQLHIRAGRLLVTPLGTNGVYSGPDGTRLADGEDFPLSVGDRFQFGKYSVLVETTPLASNAGAGASRTMIFAMPFGNSAAIPSEWEDGASQPPRSGQGSLLEAFCEGARLDPAALAADDPAEVMRRAGAAYRQMVLGLAALMSERSAAKSQYRFDRTTIGAQDNNPFKWAPSQRLGIDLLVNRDCGFLSGEHAIRSSFADLKKHLISTVAGFQASLHALLGAMDPTKIQAEAQPAGFLQSREAARWNAFEEAHRAARRQLVEDEEGPLNLAFIETYETRMRELDQDQPQ